MKTGKIKIYYKAKKFGFITGDDGNEYYFRVKHVIGDFRLKIVPGEEVTFQLETRPDKKVYAYDVARQESFEVSRLLAKAMDRSPIKKEGQVDYILNSSSPSRIKNLAMGLVLR